MAAGDRAGRRGRGRPRRARRGQRAAHPGRHRHASQQVAQSTFEATLAGGTRVRATTDDYLAAIGATRPTLDPDDVLRFQEDIERFQRT